MSDKSRLNNIKFVEQLMSVSPYGGLVQAFVIEALRSYSEHVASAEVDYNPNALIDPETWKKIAEDVLKQIKAQYAGGI